ncbi:MAG TPA: hypothetical protein VJC16_00515 [Candidatus Nanoarchaeia archaeon]|nr:hypothetical protein [Candidatus Nanoarchaeia archaeon]
MHGLGEKNLRELFFDNIHTPAIKYEEDFKVYLEGYNLFEAFKLVVIAQLFKEYSPEEAAFLALYRYHNGFFSYTGVYKENQSRNSLNLPKSNSNEDYSIFIKESPFLEFIDFVLSDKLLRSGFDTAPIFKPYIPIFITIKLLKQINKNNPKNNKIYHKINEKYSDIEKTSKKLILDFDKNWLNVAEELDKYQGWRS